MDVRMAIAVAPEGTNVAAFCREHGISRETFYVWKRRFAAEGPGGLAARSRAPKINPRRVSGDVEDAVVALRKELEDLGGDHDATTIQHHLHKRGMQPVPSAATIWRVLRRRGFITPQPQKKPKSSWRRFVASAPNELWQADCTDWTIATGVVKILSFLDDHSRVALRVKAMPAATTEATWVTFCEATALWGVPLGQLTDNGLNFSGKMRGFEVQFEIELRRIGVVAKTSRGYHPQTCGKVERFQQTMKKWLRKKPLANNLDELQAQLDAFVAYYNFERPHRGINRQTPAAAWAATPPAINLGTALPGPGFVIDAIADHSGIVGAGRYTIGLGSEYAGKTFRIHHDETHAAVFAGHDLIRVLPLDPTRRYQGTGKSRGRRTRSLL
jgi:transposase InsO family protein